MQILRPLGARRAASTIIASPVSEHQNDEEDFFDLDFSSSSFRTSSSSSGSLSFSDSDDECTVLDFIMSLQRSSSSSPLIGGGATAAPLKSCPSDPPPKMKAGRKRGINSLRTLSFDARKDVPVYGRRSSRSARSLRLLMDSTSRTMEDEHAVVDAAQTSRRSSSRGVVRTCLAKISRRIRTASSARGIRGLRKCRSASSGSAPACGDDDLAAEKHDGIAGAIAHCKESLRRASTSECDSRLLRSRNK